MNFASLLLVIVLLCGVGLSGLAAKVNDNEVKHIDVKRNENCGSKIKFTDIIFDVLTIILDFTDVVSLMNIGRVIPPLSSLTTKILDERNAEFFIHHVSWSDYINATKYKANFSCEFLLENKRIETNDSEIALKTLEHCGPIIRRLTFRSISLDKNETIQVAQFINKFGSDSLTYLSLRNTHEYTLEQFTVPFSNVEELTLEITKHGSENKYPLNQLFPKLRQLNMYLHYNASYDIFFCEFSQLDHILCG